MMGRTERLRRADSPTDRALSAGYAEVRDVPALHMDAGRAVAVRGRSGRGLLCVAAALLAAVLLFASAAGIASADEAVAEASVAEAPALGEGACDLVSAEASASASETAPVRGEELAGADRYETALSVMHAAYAEDDGTWDAEGIIVTTGESFPDALTACALAGALDYPLILAEGGFVSDDTLRSISSLQLEDVVIVGGEHAVGSDAEAVLRAVFGEDAVRRIAGSDRYGTALELYAAGRAEGAWGTTAIVATGEDYPDALSVSAYAFRNAAPIFLCEGGEGLDEATCDALREGGFSRVVAVGGEQAVSPEAFRDVQAVVGTGNAVRLAGEDRYETSACVARFALASGAGRDCSCIATGANFPDALVGGVLAGRGNALLLLADEGACDALQVLRGDAGNEAGGAEAGQGADGGGIFGAVGEDDPEAELAKTASACADRSGTMAEGGGDAALRLFFLGGERALPRTVRDAALAALAMR